MTNEKPYNYNYTQYTEDSPVSQKVQMLLTL